MAGARVAVKTNERPGTRSQVRYVRMSASKVRVILDLVRGKQVGEASQILAFSERLASETVMKCLASAVANAAHNDDIPAEELYISACYADEGPTLKRFRPRARGRAGRIHKQTCHITIVVSRYDEDTLDELRTRAEQRSAASGGQRDSGADRRRRVAKSRSADTPADDTAEADQVADEAPTAEPAEDTAAPADDTAESAEDTADESAPDATESDEAPAGADESTEPESGEEAN